MRHLLLCPMFLLATSSAVATQMLDQSHVVTQSSGGRIVYAGNSAAQTFTAGASGLLSQVDVLLKRDSGDIGQLALEIWPVVADGPAGSTPLYSTAIDPNLISTSSTTYVSVDISAGGIAVVPGQQLGIAVSGTAGASAPHAAWYGGYPTYTGGDKFERPGSWATAATDVDYGFRTWVDPTYVPSGLTYLNLTTTSEWSASLSTSGTSTILPAGSTVRVDREPAYDNDERGLFEFDASGLPPDAAVRAASLQFDINQRSQAGSTVPIVEAYGYTANGAPTDADARGLSRLLGTSPPITNFDPVIIPLDAGEVSSMLASSPGVGIVAYEAEPYVGISVVATELASQFPSAYAPPTLSLGYSVESHPAQSHPTGDYSHDAYVDAADYTVWRDNLGAVGNHPADGNNNGTVDSSDYDVWKADFGTAPDAQTANGDFGSGDLSEWSVVIDPNTSVSAGFPRVESFDVDGDGNANSAFRVRLGRLDTSQFGGAVSIEQQLLLDAGTYTFSADVASQSLDTAGNTGPGNYELVFDGQIVDQVMLNGTLIASMQVIRDSLAANLMNVEAGYHTLGITVSRGAINARAIYQLIDNIQFTPVTSSLPLAVPEPTTAALLTPPLAALLVSRRRRPVP
jgi:hypothetical protein